jgi:hypothetical protein
MEISMILSKKRVATIEALSQRFGSPANVTRGQITIALNEKLISAWPYWITDDLSLKVAPGVWHLPTPDEFRVAERGEKVDKVMNKRTLVAQGAEVPTFTKPKEVVPEVMVDVVAAPKKTKKSKKAVLPMEIAAESNSAVV